MKRESIDAVHSAAIDFQFENCAVSVHSRCIHSLVAECCCCTRRYQFPYLTRPLFGQRLYIVVDFMCCPLFAARCRAPNSTVYAEYRMLLRLHLSLFLLLNSKTTKERKTESLYFVFDRIVSLQIAVVSSAAAVRRFLHRQLLANCPLNWLCC